MSNTINNNTDKTQTVISHGRRGGKTLAQRQQNHQENRSRLHPDTLFLIDKTSVDLTEKLLKAQVKYGLDNGWKHPPSDQGDVEGRFFMTEKECQEAFIAHVNKGDPLDVIAYAMFIREMGWVLPAIQRVI